MNDLEKLIHLQKIDSQLQELVDLLGDLPRKVEALRLEEQTLIDTVQQGRERLQEIDLLIQKLKLSVTVTSEKVAKLKDQLFLVTNNRQYDALMHEIDHLKEEQDQFELRELELEEEKERLQETNKSAALSLESLSQDLQERRQRLEDLISRTARQKHDLDGRREALVQEIGNEIVARYERISSAREGLAVVAVAKTSCGGCGSMVPPQTLSEIKAGIGLKTCDVCSRFLFWENAEPE